MVYVDDMRTRFRRMVMCHMIADTDEELRAMADRIGVHQRWCQGDHFDICLTKRKQAIEAGAIEVTQRELVAIRMRLRNRRGHQWVLTNPEGTIHECPVNPLRTSKGKR